MRTSIFTVAHKGNVLQLALKAPHRALMTRSRLRAAKRAACPPKPGLGREGVAKQKKIRLWRDFLPRGRGRGNIQTPSLIAPLDFDKSSFPMGQAHKIKRAPAPAPTCARCAGDIVGTPTPGGLWGASQHSKTQANDTKKAPAWKTSHSRITPHPKNIK